MLVVVDNASGEVLGIYLRTDGDSIVYNAWETGELCFDSKDDVKTQTGQIKFHGPGGLKVK